MFHIVRIRNSIIPTYHSIAFSSPSPLNADVLNIAHVLFFRAERPRALEISDGDMAPFMSWEKIRSHLRHCVAGEGRKGERERERLSELHATPLIIHTHTYTHTHTQSPISNIDTSSDFEIAIVSLSLSALSTT